MSLLFSRKCEYAIRAVIHLTREQVPVSVSHIAKELKVPRAFTGKILQELHRAGLLRSFSGSKGGYCLAKPPDRMTINDIIMTIDGTPFHQQCILGMPECSSRTPCPMHSWWSGISDQISAELNKPLSVYLP
ncbi:MAG: Rrf2 family transcriptional regulator [Bacteroidetes bacterium]|nr:Rrf2 family transcriptional regulator [Bacteroidota bacterium]